MLFTVLVFIGTYIWLASEKTPRHWVVLGGSLALLIGRILTPREAAALVHWETLALLLAMFVAVEVLSFFGVFNTLSTAIVCRFEKRPITLFFILPLLAGILSMGVNNITVMLFMTTLTLQICSRVPLAPIPLIMAEVCFANMMGASTLIGAPPNLVMAGVLGLGFNLVAVHMAPVVLVCAGLWILVFYTQRRGTLLYRDHSSQLIAAESPYKGSPWRIFLKIDFQTLVFFLGLYILVGALDHVGLFKMLADHFVTVQNPIVLLLVVLWSSAFVSAIVDNIPMALAMAYLVKHMTSISPGFPSGILIWSALVGLTLGGNMTPIGASPNVVAYGLLERQGIRVGWKKWIQLTVPATLAALVVASLLLSLKFHFGWY